MNSRRPRTKARVDASLEHTKAQSRAYKRRPILSHFSSVTLFIHQWRRSRSSTDEIAVAIAYRSRRIHGQESRERERERGASCLTSIGELEEEDSDWSFNLWEGAWDLRVGEAASREGEERVGVADLTPR